MFNCIQCISDYFNNETTQNNETNSQFNYKEIDKCNKDTIMLNKLINMEKNIKKLNKKIDKLIKD